MAYFLSAGVSFQLINRTGCSSSDVCERPVPIPVSDASVWTENGMLKTGVLGSIGVLVSA